MIRIILLALLLSPFLVSAQGVHPEAFNAGCCSEKTMNSYTRDPAQKEVLFPILDGGVNKVSEKTLFYEGKFDAWKAPFNKHNPLFDQIYIFPPGTLPISKGVFLDQTEVANIHYQEFLFYIAKDSGKYVDKAYAPKLENKYYHKYYDEPEFYFYPVTGVSHENAQAYCEWRAKQLNIGLKEMLKGSPKKYRYAGRLPSEAEWKKAAGEATVAVQDVHYKLGKNELKFFEEELIPRRFATQAILEITDLYAFNANFYVDPPMGLDLEIPLYIYSFPPNERGFYNMYGNVKELLDNGHAVGGSFKTAYQPESIFEEDDTQLYRVDVGFRCIVEIARRR